MNRLHTYFIKQRNNPMHTAYFYLMLSLTMALTLGAFNASANEEAVYGPVAPPGSAFIRVFNNGQATTQSATIGGKSLTVEGAYNAGPYKFFPAEDYKLTIKNNELKIKLEADHYYTAYLNAENEVTVAEGRGFKQRKKALLAFYNLLNNPISIKTANGKSTVIKSVDKNFAGFREVNAVKITLAAFNETKKVLDAKPIALKRGKIFSLFATNNASGQATLVWVQE